jgi:hypothetical protein
MSSPPDKPQRQRKTIRLKTELSFEEAVKRLLNTPPLDKKPPPPRNKRERSEPQTES